MLLVTLPLSPPIQINTVEFFALGEGSVQHRTKRPLLSLTFKGFESPRL